MKHKNRIKKIIMKERLISLKRIFPLYMVRKLKLTTMGAHNKARIVRATIHILFICILFSIMVLTLVDSKYTVYIR